MDNSFKNTNSPEKNSQLEHEKEQQSSSKAEQLQNDKELFKEVGEMIEGADVGMESGAEISDGEVNENVKEDRKKFTGASGTVTQSTAAQVAKQITPPSVDVMRTQISVKVKKEIAVLQKEAEKIIQSRNFNPFQLNAVVGRIRDLKEILASLSYATLETLKGWWFKYVKGITS